MVSQPGQGPNTTGSSHQKVKVK